MSHKPAFRWEIIVSSTILLYNNNCFTSIIFFFSFARQCSIVALFHIGMVRIDVQWLTIPVLLPPDIRLNRKENWCNLRLVVYLPQGVKDIVSWRSMKWKQSVGILSGLLLLWNLRTYLFYGNKPVWLFL